MTVFTEFQSPKRKLGRARYHIAYLASDITQLLKDTKTGPRIIEIVAPNHGGLYQRWLRMYAVDCQRVGLTPQDPPAEPAYVHKIHVLPPDTNNIELMAADAIQNLRQALDHAACACSRSIGKSDKGTYFSLAETPEKLEDRIKDQGRKLPTTIKDIIRRTGGGLLYELHDVGGGDKHRLTCDFGHQVQSQPRFLKASATGWLASGFGEDDWDPINNDIRFALSSSPDEVDYEFRLSVEIRFNSGAVIASKPAVTVLNELADTVASVIGEMETEMTRLVALGQT